MKPPSTTVTAAPTNSSPEPRRSYPVAFTAMRVPVASLPGAFPYYAERALGSRYWDVDGNEYIDYLCGYGPMVLGHQHPEVEEAAARQQAKALCVNHPGEIMVELADTSLRWSIFPPGPCSARTART
jgi:glutamate-1-semialdehyde aminotransferase